MKAIELKNVSFSYEGYEEKVLNDASLSVDYGEVALLSGFSGEGKSTVLSLIAGIIPNITPGEITGEVLIGGADITGWKMGEICRKVGVVLQNAEAQIIQQIVEDEIAFGGENFAFPREKIADSIERACHLMKLDPGWKTRTLSGGQKQRLITAATLATEQKILVLDEPLANLDRYGSELLMDTLRRLAKAGYAILVVEHRLDMVLPYVDTVWSIRGGEISKIENKKEYLAAQAELIKDTCCLKSTDGTAFQLEHVKFSVKGREILKDITFQIKKGERVKMAVEKRPFCACLQGFTGRRRGVFYRNSTLRLDKRQKEALLGLKKSAWSIKILITSYLCRRWSRRLLLGRSRMSMRRRLCSCFVSNSSPSATRIRFLRDRKGGFLSLR